MSNKYKSEKLKNSRSLRLSDSATKQITYMAKENHINESELLRSIIEKALAEYRLKKALMAVDKGHISISAGAKMAEISYREFYNKMDEYGVKIGYNISSLNKSMKYLDELIPQKKSKLKAKS